MTTRRRRWDVLLSAALFLLLALLFVPECDDCYFIYWDFASWKDFLLVRPIPQEGVVLGVPSNGRYLGNLLGLILGGGMLGLTLLLSRFFQGGPAGGRESFALALFLVVWAPWGIWQQVSPTKSVTRFHPLKGWRNTSPSARLRVAKRINWRR